MDTTGCCRTARDSEYCGWKQQRLISEAESAAGWAAVPVLLMEILLVLLVSVSAPGPMFDNDVQIGKQPPVRVHSIDNKVFSLRIV